MEFSIRLCATASFTLVMTLQRQLLIAISLLFLVVFLVVEGLSIVTTRNYLQQQLASHAQDAATTLSKSLEKAMASKDRTLAEVEIASMFDRGYYQSMQVLDNQGRPFVSKELSSDRAQTPGWLPDLLNIRLPAAEAFISSGWRQLGKVVVLSHPAYAYAYLWQSMKTIALWMSVMYLVVLALSMLMLRLILRPLEKIEALAHAVQEKRFEPIALQPRAPELQKVVTAMNQMAQRISHVLDQERANAEQYRRAAFQDSVTGLENRQGFDLRLNQLLAQDERSDQTWLAVFELDGLKTLNQRQGYARGNDLLVQLAQCLKQQLHPERDFAGRMGGAAIALVCTGVDAAQMQEKRSQWQQGLQQLVAAVDDSVQLSAAMLACAPGQNRKELLSQADLLLEQSRQQGQGKIICAEEVPGTRIVEGSQAWRLLIANALHENRWVLYTQPVVQLDSRQQTQHELYVRLLDEKGSVLTAAEFMPMAVRHQLSAEIDQAVISLALQAIQAEPQRFKALAVNVSMASVSQPAFCLWLAQACQAAAPLPVPLYLELSEFACVKQRAESRQFFRMLRELGLGFGLDHVGLDPLALQLIRDNPPDYIKLDSGLIAQIATQPDIFVHVEALVRFAQSLEIPCIAQGIEDEALIDLLRQAQVEAGQGYVFGMPEKLERRFQPYL
ncbi:MAG: bifunctional diguanylate cyclase/phosphodiesterase [Undibacterium curvum]|uniref:bifunctional diguanylate cyclase/phosphodiesterase n=1 Tax=Undibacterium curvum TaxID=2762294 RepID=UPI003BD58342